MDPRRTRRPWFSKGPLSPNQMAAVVTVLAFLVGIAIIRAL
jgi:hypothetical protein